MKKVGQYINIIIGNLLIAFAVSGLIVENSIISGGVSGIGLSISHYFNVPFAIITSSINVGLFLLGYFCLGKEFASKTLLSTILFPIFLNYFEAASWLRGLFVEPFIVCLCAGTCVGVGIGLVMKAECSTGGVDIIALVVSKKFHIPVHIILNIIDIIILLAQMMFSAPTKIIYGLVIVFMTSMVLNKTLTSGTSLIQLTIMSNHYEAIREYILNQADAGITLLNSQKGFSLEETKVLLSIIPYHKLTSIKLNILRIDPTAFIIVSKVEEVGGRGFTIER